MFNRTFWNLLSGFVLILVVSFSLITLFGVFRDSQESMAALWEALHKY